MPRSSVLKWTHMYAHSSAVYFRFEMAGSSDFLLSHKVRSLVFFNLAASFKENMPMSEDGQYPPESAVSAYPSRMALQPPG